MAFQLGPKALAAGYRLSAFERIGSTSAEALALAAKGDPGRLWVVTGEQTAGHGRRGRAWETARGNLAASLLIVRGEARAAIATLGFAAGLALECAVRTVAGRDIEPSLALKWPNDVLLSGAKVAGILLEAVTQPGGASSVVIGIGVNVRHAPTDVSYPATALAKCAVEATAETLFTALSDAWVDQEFLWDEGHGFPALREHWLERASGLGAPIAVRIGDEELRGTFETIDNDGRLIIRASDGSSRAISAGDVHFGVAATARN